MVTDYLQFAEQQTLNCYEIGLRKQSKYNVPQHFVDMLLQNNPWLVRYKKAKAMSFLSSVECGKFRLKKAFQSGKILACTKKSEIWATFTFKLIKMMLKCQVA